MKWPAYVLAGGRSSRLGQDKARASIDDETTVIEAVVSSLFEQFSRWTVIAERAGKFEDLNLRTIADETPHQGPVGGILRACQDCESEYFFIVSCDRVGLKAQWAAQLAQVVDEQRPTAVTFEFDDRLEPLFGFYRADLEATIQGFIDDGHRAVWRLLDEIGAQAVDAPCGWEETISVNTPADLARARLLRANPSKK